MSLEDAGFYLNHYRPVLVVDKDKDGIYHRIGAFLCANEIYAQGVDMAAYTLLDADSHVSEPLNLWQERLPAKYRDKAPADAHGV